MYNKDDEALSSERLLNEQQYPQVDSKFDRFMRNERKSFFRRNAGLILQILLFIASASMLLASYIREGKGGLCKDYMPQWSPALEAVKDSGHKQRFDGSFATPNAFKGSPSPLIDESWDNITYATGKSGRYCSAFYLSATTATSSCLSTLR